MKKLIDYLILAKITEEATKQNFKKVAKQTIKTLETKKYLLN